MVKTVKHPAGSPDHLATLSDLLQHSGNDTTMLFEHGLALLVQALGVDRALVTRITGLGYEVFWWSLSPGASMDGIFEAPEKGFRPFVIAHPDRILTIPNTAVVPRWRKSTGHLELGIRAYTGVALKVGDKVHGTLCVQHHSPRAFTRGQLALLKTMGHLMARTLESEHLKQELRAALDALALSSAIVEDSALVASDRAFPTEGTLDIWLHASLFMARRRREPMVIALWSQPMVPGTKGRLAAVAKHLRGEDLLVELSSDQYLLLLPHTSDTGAEVLLERLRHTMGHHPTGATMWLPDGKDMTMKSALHRAAKAFTEANRKGAELLWHR